MRAPTRFAGVVCLGLSGFTFVGCGGSAAPDGDAAKSTAISANSKDVKALLEKATTSIQKKQWQQALIDLSDAIKLDPKSGEAFFHRASLLADAGQAQAALSDFSKAIELLPNDPKLRHTRGFFLMTHKQVEAAIADFTKAIELNPQHSQAFNNRGLALLTKGDKAKAVADFDQALKIEPKYVEALINRGFVSYQLGKLKSALADYDLALKINPDNVNALNNRGLAFFQSNEFERAAADFTQAIARDRYNAKYYIERRSCLLKLGRDDEAQADAAKVAWLGKLNELNRTVAQSPKDPDQYVQLAEHLISGGEPKVALASLETAMKVQPDYGKAYSSRAAYWLTQNELDKAINDCDRALSVEPHFEAYSVRGDAYFLKRDFDRAIADYQKAKRMDSQVAKAFLHRAKQRAANGRDADAAKDRERAYAIEPSFRPAE